MKIGKFFLPTESAVFSLIFVFRYSEVLGQYGTISLDCRNGYIFPGLPIGVSPIIPAGQLNPARRNWREAVVRLERQVAWLRARIACGSHDEFRPPYNFFFNQPPKCPPPPSNSAQLIPAGRYCDQYYNRGVRGNGIYSIIVLGELIEVYCEFELDGHNWIVFQRRQDNTVDFYQDWRTYQIGFGRIGGNFWLGLDNLHRLTRSGTCKLRVDLMDFSSNTAFAEYSTFQIGPPESYYQISVGYFRGTAGDSLRRHNNMRFSTRDFDNDNWEDANCAVDNRGAWWYNACQYSNLNGQYLPGGMMSTQGINWYHWKYNTLSMMTASMKMRDC